MFHILLNETINIFAAFDNLYHCYNTLNSEYTENREHIFLIIEPYLIERWIQNNFDSQFSGIYKCWLLKYANVFTVKGYNL